MTGREWVTASLRLIGAVSPGESISSTEAVDGLAAGNRMLGAWSADGMLIPAETREQFSLTAGDGSYTIGSGGNFNTTRPIKILSAFIRSEASSPALDYPPLKALTLDEWVMVSQKESGNSVPHSIYDDGAHPLRTLYLYPEPASSLYLVLHTRKALTEISTLETSVSLPPGYDEALIYNLSIRLSPEYGRPVSAEVAKIASDSLAAVSRANFKPDHLRSDDALVVSRQYDINTGES